MWKLQLSPQGHLILPKALLEGLGWVPGTEIEVCETTKGFLVERQIERQNKLRPVTTIDDLIGFIKYDGPGISIDDMDPGRARPQDESLSGR